MTPEEAKRRVAEQDAEIARLEAQIADLAGRHPAQAMLQIITALVDTVCGINGPNFYALNKLRFYRAVIAALGRKGIT